MKKVEGVQDLTGQKNFSGACETLEPASGFLRKVESRGVTALECGSVGQFFPAGQASEPGRRPQGGRTTISPPPNVHDPSKSLASGLDKLVLALDVMWFSESFFQKLQKAKEQAIEEERDLPFKVHYFGERDNQDWECLVKPHGTAGYEWLLIGKDFSMKIGNWMKPTTRPSVMVEIHSETLWRMGPEKAVKAVRWIIVAAGGKIVKDKVSRVDLCADTLMPVELWTRDLEDYLVSRAGYTATHKQDRQLEGFSVGKGQVSLRVYDKLREIKRASKKTWFFDIWDLEEPGEAFRVIRVEYQLRREALKECGIDQVPDLFAKLLKLWAYCTVSWARYADHPERHTTKRKDLPWWEVVKGAFSEGQKVTPLIREKSCCAEEKQLYAQAFGMLTALEDLGQVKRREKKEVGLFQALMTFLDMGPAHGKGPDEFASEIRRKLARYARLVVTAPAGPVPVGV